MENRFNLIDEPWIPVADHGRVSLRQIFSNPEYRSLGGNPVQKIALLKLLLAIAQAAATPKDETEWKALGVHGLAERCLGYLDKWYDRFYLYGDKPFLQMPAIRAAKVQPFGAVIPEISIGNTTVLSHTQVQRVVDDAERALLLVGVMGFAFGGKGDNSVVLTSGYSGKTNAKGKKSVSKPGVSLGTNGFTHSFLMGASLSETVWLNLMSTQQIEQMNIYPDGIGAAPWEQMPEGEDCPVARVLKRSLIGRLVSLSYFCLLTDKGLHFSEGVAHYGYKDGFYDPSMAINYSSNEPKALWVDPEKRPWRSLTALLNFIEQDFSQGFQCWQLYCGLDRAAEESGCFSVWTGGLSVSGGQTNKQFVSGRNDFVESQVWLHSDILGQSEFSQLKQEMGALDSLAKNLYGRVQGFFKEQTVDGSKVAPQATQLFWQLCERDFQHLVDSCEQSNEAAEARQKLRQRFASYVQQSYDKFCPHETARQLDAWAKCRPNNSNYLKQEA
ncbi:type I-E CRISPR-associated protein Cse1/CasA [Marinobacter sp. SS21]|uniref:type I-E CRISPR-associated protein Cse1/CasA n=1 Tax=Marinobacter sp. SS21 TaxID=2979460 RepID=UPI00232C04CB|nr:type I-E CRISPR-associated protein Cse1/CasA [Marinobacter sp. SS21]MDC0662560.1 type I-E CRISPR-associated protein Cse1/CasA [Marinobacter sp. SS21]